MKQKRSLLLVFMLAFALLVTACSNDAPAEEPATDVTEEETTETVETDGETLLMATTTSTDDTGLLDALKPKFKEDTGIDLDWVAVGTGEALRMGRDGEADVLLVHARASEEEFIDEGYGVERFPVMYNDFVVVGPEGSIDYSNNAEEFFQTLVDQGLTFVSRGDDSGTHKKELSIWEDLGIDPEEYDHYVNAGQGMADTIILAEEQEGLVLTDRGTWLSISNSADLDMSNTVVLLENDPILYNQYGVIAVNPEKYPETNIDAANAFIEWIRSEEIQDFIESFGVDEYNEPLFIPNADDLDA